VQPPVADVTELSTYDRLMARLGELVATGIKTPDRATHRRQLRLGSRRSRADRFVIARRQTARMLS